MTDIDDITGMSTHDAVLWRDARTLGDLGELTAQWLEGTIGSIPGVVPGYGPDEETVPLVPVLAAVNRAGLETQFSQPGEDKDGWIQRAAVSGFASDATFRTLLAVTADADLMITAARAGETDWGTTMVVTINNGRENTWAGATWSCREIQDCYGDCCHAAGHTLDSTVSRFPGAASSPRRTGIAMASGASGPRRPRPARPGPSGRECCGLVRCSAPAAAARRPGTRPGRAGEACWARPRVLTRGPRAGPRRRGSWSATAAVGSVAAISAATTA